MMVQKKKGAIEVDTLIILIVVVLLILLLLFLIFDNQITDWFKNLSGYNKEDLRDKLIEDLPEDLQALLNYFKVAVVQEGSKINFCTGGDCNKLRPSKLYWTGSEQKGVIYVEEAGWFGFDSWDLDDEVGSVSGGRVSLSKDLLSRINGGFEIKEELIVDNKFSKEDLLNLDGGIYISGVIYRERSASDQEASDWEKILKEYEKTKCVVSKDSCQIAKFPCSCFTKTDYDLKEMFDTCESDTHYCYNREAGCSRELPDAPLGIGLCKDSLKDDFVQAPKCEVDLTSCSVLNSPCSCPAGGTLVQYNEDDSVPLPVCVSRKYCYYGEIGCSDYGSDTSRGINNCKEALGNKFIQAPDCKIDTNDKVTNAPCSCGSFGGLAQLEKGENIALVTCNVNQYCYKNGIGCSDTKK